MYSAEMSIEMDECQYTKYQDNKYVCLEEVRAIFLG